MCDANSLLVESREALGKIWFLQSLEVSEGIYRFLIILLYLRHRKRK